MNVKKVLKFKKNLKKRVLGWQVKPEWWGDGLGVRGKNLSFMEEDRFKQAVAFGYEGNKISRERTGFDPKIPWRTHVCIWAAANGLRLEGDFVECGVNTGMFSMAVCQYLDIDKYDKTFYLFDTFCGIPMEGLKNEDKTNAEKMNGIYCDVYDIATKNFSSFRNAKLIKGALPGSLNLVNIKNIAYLSIDLNNATYEKETIEALWDKLSPCAMVIIDDYAFMGHIPQYEMWNQFAASKKRMILTVPTGQGLLQK